METIWYLHDVMNGLMPTVTVLLHTVGIFCGLKWLFFRRKNTGG